MAIPEPQRSRVRAASTGPGPELGRVEPARRDDTPIAPRAHPSSRARLIVGFVLVDALITVGVIWWLTS